MLVTRTFDRITVVTPSRRQWGVALGWAGTNWVLDCACLVVAFVAVGTPVPWRVVLLAYGAGQLATNLPITPGGLGVVEGSLTIALVAYGGDQAGTAAAVLLYRLLSFWLPLPLGWGAAAYWELRGPKRSPNRPIDRSETDDGERAIRGAGRYVRARE